MAKDKLGMDVTLVPLPVRAGAGEQEYYEVWVADKGVGTLSFLAAGDTVAGIWVADEERHRGVGRAAMAELFATHPMLEAVNGDSHPASHDFWEALGCEWQDGRDDENCCLFELSRTALRA